MLDKALVKLALELATDATRNEKGNTALEYAYQRKM